MLSNDPLNLAPLVAVLLTFNVIRYQHKNGVVDIRLLLGSVRGCPPGAHWAKFGYKLLQIKQD